MNRATAGDAEDMQNRPTSAVEPIVTKALPAKPNFLHDRAWLYCPRGNGGGLFARLDSRRKHPQRNRSLAMQTVWKYSATIALNLAFAAVCGAMSVSAANAGACKQASMLRGIR